jgi:hypothetical protein
MVTLTKNESHVVLLRFMMLITKVNVNIMRCDRDQIFLVCIGTGVR